MTLEEMKFLKRMKGYTYAMMSKKSGVPLGTIQKIFNGETKSPRYGTMVALESILKEPEPSYVQKKQGEYTISDLEELPEDSRYELIDGFLYQLGTPTTFHQLIMGEVFRQIANYIHDKKGNCMPFLAPTAVQLDCDDRTVLLPDVIILCDRNKGKKWGIYGAPEFVLEVISPSTKKRDYGIKLEKYMQAGVKEYWIVDPYKKCIIVYHLEGDIMTTLYGFEADVPIKLYNNELKINISSLRDLVDNLMEKTE